MTKLQNNVSKTQFIKYKNYLYEISIKNLCELYTLEANICDVECSRKKCVELKHDNLTFSLLIFSGMTMMHL